MNANTTKAKPEEWKKYRLGEVCSRVCSGGTPKSTVAEYYDGNIPWLNTKEIDFNFIEKTDRCITQAGLDNSSAKWIDANTVIIAMYGATAGKCAITKIKLTTNQACCNLGVNPDLADYRFVYYAVKNDYVRLASLANGGAQQNLNAQQIKDFELSLPPLPHQRRIAAVLSSLDAKIETNRKINSRLEEMAQALFRSWFIDFEPFQDGEFVEDEFGRRPKGWEVGKLNKLLKLKRDNIRPENKGDLPYLPIDVIPMRKLGIECFKSSVEAQSSLQLFETDDIIIGAMRVYFHRVVIAPFKGITRNTCFVLTPFDKDYLYYSLLLCNQDETINYADITSKGTTMPYATWDGGLADYEVLIPDKKCIQEFNNVVRPIVCKIRDSFKESSRLSALRDALLPKLMSGELIPEEIKI